MMTRDCATIDAIALILKFGCNGIDMCSGCPLENAGEKTYAKDLCISIQEFGVQK